MLLNPSLNSLCPVVSSACSRTLLMLQVCCAHGWCSCDALFVPLSSRLCASHRDHFCQQLDNSTSGIKATIGKLMQLLAAHDPELAAHLHKHKVSLADVQALLQQQVAVVAGGPGFCMAHLVYGAHGV